MKPKILAHITKENEYRSFIQGLYNCEQIIDVSAAVVHGNLFELYHQYKPNIFILAANEYTQEFHDFIEEFHSSVKIVVFINVPIQNPQMIQYWNGHGIVCIGNESYIPSEMITNKALFYDKLFNDAVFNKSTTDIFRNEKIAVMLSVDDEKNDAILGQILYPNTKEPLVLFNSVTYNKSQNVGFLTPVETCEIFNKYKCLLDLDNKYALEAEVCGIDNIVTEGDILYNINNRVVKIPKHNLEQSSFRYFVQNQFLPTIIRGS